MPIDIKGDKGLLIYIQKLFLSVLQNSKIFLLTSF